MSRMRRNRRLLLASPGPGQARLLACGGFQVQNPNSPAGGVISAVIALDHGAPGLERPHCKRVSLEIVARVVEDFIRVPVVREDRVSGMYAQDGVEAVVRRFGPNVAGRTALLAFGDDIAFLRNRTGRRCRRVGAHSVSAMAAASTAEAILTRFFASAA